MNALRAIRQSKNWYQIELAIRAGISQQELSRLERGLRRGRPATWRKLAAVLGVSVEVLRGKIDGQD